MLPDCETNFLYLADSLPKKYPDFYTRLKALLVEKGITHGILPGTKDVWAVDYMPIQMKDGSFTQFLYRPDYLRNSSKWRKTISDVDSICKTINVYPTKRKIVVDGGNLIKIASKAIMCDKVFSENPTISKENLIKELKESLLIEELIFIPTHPEDFTGHADGVVRFFDEHTVLVNDYSASDQSYMIRLETVLGSAALNIIRIPYNPFENDSIHEANGVYINFLEMQDFLILPIFNMKEDELALQLFQQLYGKENILTIDCNEIAYDGGILNCVSWNICV